MTKKRIIWFVLLIIVIGVIFYFSNQVGEISYAISNAVAERMNIAGNEWLSASEKPLLFGLNLRKWAHVGLYAGLGLVAWLLLKSLWKSLSLCYALACLDEIHQIFVDGRGACITDTFIDSIGFGVVILACFTASKIIFCNRRVRDNDSSNRNIDENTQNG